MTLTSVYCFYRPFHLCHIEVPSTIARAVLLHDATITPLGAPTVEVISTAKIDLEAGQTLDGLGCYTLYGQCENADVVQAAEEHHQARTPNKDHLSRFVLLHLFLRI
jgi:predicted homoserine dehydrogenase-like protein